MFRLRLHPTPSAFVVGIAVIAFWALLWVWLLAQLVGSTPGAVDRGIDRVVARIEVERAQ
jgi:hypothetical protein